MKTDFKINIDKHELQEILDNAILSTSLLEVNETTIESIDGIQFSLIASFEYTGWGVHVSDWSIDAVIDGNEIYVESDCDFKEYIIEEINCRI